MGGFLCNPQHQVDGLKAGTNFDKDPFEVNVAFPILALSSGVLSAS